MKNYYAILGLEKSCSQADVQRAYKRLVQFYHPDHNVGQEEWAANLFRQVQEAYDVLSDPLKRKRYDAGPRVAEMPKAGKTLEEMFRETAIGLASSFAERVQESDFRDALLDRLVGKKKSRKRGAA